MVLEAYVWGTSEAAMQKGRRAQDMATLRFIVESIVKRFGGSIETDGLTEEIAISVPLGKEEECALAIEEELAGMR